MKILLARFYPRFATVHFSLEVFADDFAEMERRGAQTFCRNWGENVYVKVPVTNTKAEPALALIRRLSAAGIKLNVTAMTTLQQLKEVVPALAKGPAAYVSVFSGRVADTGIDPVPLMAEVVALLAPRSAERQELVWASPREVLNVVQAESVGCHIITATSDILKKLELLGRDLTEYSLDTVKMFRRDALQAGFQL